MEQTYNQPGEEQAPEASHQIQGGGGGAQPDLTAGPDHEHQVQDDVEAVPDKHGEGEDDAVVTQHCDALLQSLQARFCDPELLIRS